MSRQTPAKKKVDPPPPPTDTEISLGLISELVKSANALVISSKSFMNEIDIHKKVYSEEIIEAKILDNLDTALSLKDLVVDKKSSVEKALASNQTLEELWTAQIYAEYEEDEAVKKLMETFKTITQVMNTKSYKKLLKP